MLKQRGCWSPGVARVFSLLAPRDLPGVRGDDVCIKLGRGRYKCTATASLRARSSEEKSRRARGIVYLNVSENICCCG
jgi:hypothetical protein